MFGSFPSADAAIAAAHVHASFKSLLVTRCQFEFERTVRACVLMPLCERLAVWPSPIHCLTVFGYRSASTQNKRSAASKEKEGAAEAEMDPRQKEIVRVVLHVGPAVKLVVIGVQTDARVLQMAIRAKRHMLGNIRFIGELFKVDMLKVRTDQFSERTMSNVSCVCVWN